jgi:putative Ca2+/H+ antiporter (TMEM165/GDT1 family)
MGDKTRLITVPLSADTALLTGVAGMAGIQK